MGWRDGGQPISYHESDYDDPPCDDEAVAQHSDSDEDKPDFMGQDGADMPGSPAIRYVLIKPVEPYALPILTV